MSAPPDFKQLAGYSVPPEYVAHVAEQFRQVWNARGAADAQVIAAALAEKTDIAPWAELHALDR